MDKCRCRANRPTIRFGLAGVWGCLTPRVCAGPRQLCQARACPACTRSACDRRLKSVVSGARVHTWSCKATDSLRSDETVRVSGGPLELTHVRMSCATQPSSVVPRITLIGPSRTLRLQKAERRFCFGIVWKRGSISGSCIWGSQKPHYATCSM